MRTAFDLVPFLVAVLLVRAAQGGEVDANSVHAITLPEAIDEALSRAPDLLAAGESVAQARADLRTASLLPNPQLITGTTLQHLPGGQFTAQNPGGPPQYNVDVNEQVDGFLFGKR